MYITKTAKTNHKRRIFVKFNKLSYQELSGIPVQQHFLDDTVNPSSENGKKSKRRRISECLTVYHFTVILVLKVSYFLVGSQDVRHRASGDQQLSLRKYGGMRN